MHLRTRLAGGLRWAAGFLVIIVSMIAGLFTPVNYARASNYTGSASGSTAPYSPSRIRASFTALDHIVKTDMRKTGVPGVAVAVVSGNSIVYQKGFGVRSTKTRQPVNARTVFQLASLSKPISSTVMAGLVGRGVIGWDDPIHKYAPEYTLSDPWVTDHVTFADLFSHRSGLPGGSGNDLESLGYDQATILQRLRYVPLQPFRTTYSYSNFGMTLGAVAAAQAAHSTWDQVAQQVLFGPAGMTSTSMSYAGFLAQNNRAELHVKIDGKWVPKFTREPDAQAPAGGASSNVIDLGTWMRIQLNGGMLGKRRIIAQAPLNATHTPQIMSRAPDPISSPADFYGLGWGIRTAPNGDVEWAHSGAFSVGASTTVQMIPARKIGIVVLTNASPIGLAETIASDYLSDVRTGTSNADTLAANLKRFSNIYGPKPDQTPPANATPARDPSAYVGTYYNDYVGDVRVVSVDGSLQLVAGPKNMTFTLRHFDGNTFFYTSAPETPAYPSKITFDIGSTGTATALTDSEFEGAGQATLTRTTS